MEEKSILKDLYKLLDNKPHSQQFEDIKKKGIPPTIKRVCPESHHQEVTGGKLPDDAPHNESSPSQQ
jgi:hypothetical protein